VARVPLAFCFLCSFPFVLFHCLASLSLVISLVRLFPLLHYFGERVAATEPDLLWWLLLHRPYNSTVSDVLLLDRILPYCSLSLTVALF